MASSYPAGYDALTNPASSDSMQTVSHSDNHTAANDAVEAVQAELGLDPAGSSDTVVARLNAVDTAVEDAESSAKAYADTQDDSHSAADRAYTDAEILALNIDDLADVDTTTTAPVTDDVLAWDGSGWVPTENDNVAVVDPSTDHAVPRFDGVAGALQDTEVTVDDSDNLLVPGKITHSASEILHTENAGTPNGVVTAVVGSTCVDTLADTGIGGDGKTVYVKATGSGNTGWVVSSLVGWAVGDNTASGRGALRDNVDGIGNSGFGYDALQRNVSGNNNVGMGVEALSYNTSGSFNLAIGGRALTSNVSGNNNVGIGYWAGRYATGSDNVSIGMRAGYAANSTDYSVGIGSYALYGNLATGCTGVGGQALYSNTTGTGNVGVGQQAGYKPRELSANATTTAEGQTLIGRKSGQGSPAQSDYISTLGYRAICDGAYALALGAETSAGAAGAVAIGTSAAGVGASTSTADEFVLGTSAHDVLVPGTLSTTHGDETMKAELAAATDFADFQSRMAAL